MSAAPGAGTEGCEMRWGLCADRELVVGLRDGKGAGSCGSRTRGRGLQGSGAGRQLWGLDVLVECSEGVRGLWDEGMPEVPGAAALRGRPGVCPRSIRLGAGQELEAPRVGIEGRGGGMRHCSGL